MRNSVPLITGDCLLVALSWTGAFVLRYDGRAPAGAWEGLFSFLPAVLVVTMAGHAVAGLYSSVLTFASILEARQILLAQGASLALLLPAAWALGRPVPLSVPVMATVLSCGGAAAVRFWSRLLRWRRLTDEPGERILVIGAGEAGHALITSIQQQRSGRAVAILDDDERLWGLRIHGVRVLGPVGALARIAEETVATRAVLAIAEASPDLVRAVAGLCAERGIGLSVVPPPVELIGRQVSLQDVRDLDIADLLGRAQVDTDLGVISALIAGHRVLITGAGGSIGSELARQVAAFGPARLTLVDHDETHLFDATAAIDGPAVERLVDIRDHTALLRVFAEEQPDVVFHAAAHKHVPLLEAHPVQAAHTNILGTHNVLRCAEAVGVRRFVFISTDKAVRPSSVMGATKAVGEQLVLGHTHMNTCAVRFGNVLGSRGSVVPTFVRQIRAGGPVTITDARMTRYFMSIPEAVRLVLHAAALSTGGEIFMLDMGEPVRILDLAKRMIQLSGQRPGIDVEIRVTAVRPGEKLAEQLHAPDEHRHATSHPSVLRLDPVRLPHALLERMLREVGAAVETQDDRSVRKALWDLLRARTTPATSVPLQRGAGTGSEPAWT